MRIGDFEGTPQEIRDLFEVHGLQLSDYLRKPKEPLANRWLIIPAALLLALIFGLFIAALGGQPTFVLSVLFLLGACALLWLAVSIQLRFDSAWATGVAALGGLLLLLLAAGFIGPKEGFEAMKEMVTPK